MTVYNETKGVFAKMSLFLDKIYERAKTDKKTIVLPESTDIRVVEAASKLLSKGIANVVLVGNEKDIKKLGSAFDLSGVGIVNPEESDKFEDYAQTLFELRKKKGMTLNVAKEKIRNPLYWGVMMVKKGEASPTNKIRLS